MRNFILKALQSLVCLMLITACETFKIKNKGEPGDSATPPPQTIGTIPYHKQVSPTATPGPQLQTGEPTIPEIITKVVNQPKIGIIVGPGHLRTYIAVGILQELQKAKMPIHAMIGLEWGALPAALFSLHGQANEIEWQMMKLKEKDFPQKGLISQKIEGAPVSTLDGFLNEAFANLQFEQSKIPFTCLSLDLNKRQYFWMKRGEFRSVLPNCLSHPPYFYSENNLVAGVDLKLSSDYLRQQGATYIILINLLPIAGDPFEKDELSYSTQALWANHQQNLARNTLGSIDYVIDTSSVANKALDFANRREMVLKGQEIGRIIAKKLSPKLGF